MLDVAANVVRSVSDLTQQAEGPEETMQTHVDADDTPHAAQEMQVTTQQQLRQLAQQLAAAHARKYGAAASLSELTVPQPGKMLQQSGVKGCSGYSKAAMLHRLVRCILFRARFAIDRASRYHTHDWVSAGAGRRNCRSPALSDCRVGGWGCGK